MFKTGQTQQTEGLTARRKSVIQEAQNMLNSADPRAGLSPAVEARFDGLLLEADRLQSQIELSYRTPQSQRLISGLDSAHYAARPSEGDPTEKAFYNYLKSGMDGLSHDDRAIAMQHFQQPSVNAAQGVGTGSGGWFAVPDAPMGTMVISPHVSRVMPSLRSWNVMVRAGTYVSGEPKPVGTSAATVFTACFASTRTHAS